MNSRFGTTKSFTSFVVAALILSAFLSAIGGDNVAHAAAPAGFADILFADGLDTPTAMEFAPDGRLFVSEKGGALRIIKEGILLSTPFASLSVNSEGERGLMGIAFDPNFAQNGYVYVYYTTSADPVHNKVSRLTADPANPDRALAGSEHTILDLEPLTTEFHNAGSLEFGPEDGKLYVSTGDNYYPYLAQSLSSRFGKILRINSDGTIPTDNPFYNIAGAYGEIWALGLRNPFTFAFSPADSKMHINDVGQDSWEEINLGQRGANYGWPACEGMCSDPQFTDPVHSYPHPSGAGGSSIAGGAFYAAASQFPSEYQGSYFFGDYVGGFIKRLTSENQAVDFLTEINSPIDIEVDPTENDGSLYYLSIGAGEVRKVQFTTQGNYQPTASANASQTSGLSPLAVTFDGSESMDPNGDALTYRWDFGDGSSPASGIQVTHTYTADGPYVATLTVSDGKGSTDSDTIEITIGNPPAGIIETPPLGTSYNAGDTITFSGSGSDTEDGALPASAFHWKVDFHHNTHTHPLQDFDGIRSGSFTIPTVGETDNDVWYRVYLTVTDSSGLVHESTRDILPNQSTITLASNVTGLELVLDGQPRMTPYSSAGVVGVERTVEAPTTQIIGGQRHDFLSWSDGGERVHTIVVPESNATTTLTAHYSAGTAAIPKTLEIHSADLDGNSLTGHYATIRESSKNTTLHTGYTPVNFTGYEGTSYTVSIRDYGNSTFDHWDDGSANRVRTLTLNDDTVTTAHYRTVSANTTGVPPPNTAPDPSPQSPTTHNLTITSADLDGNSLAGRYIVVAESSSGAIIHTGYTPLNFTGTSGTSYVVIPQDDTDAVFDHWEDQSRDRSRTIVLNGDTAIAAYYDNNITAAPPVPYLLQDKDDEEEDDDDKGPDDSNKKDKKKKDSKDKDADDDNRSGSKTETGSRGSLLRPLGKGFEEFLQLIRSNSWLNP